VWPSFLAEGLFRQLSRSPDKAAMRRQARVEIVEGAKAPIADVGDSADD